MSRLVDDLARSLLHRLDPETAHGLALRALRHGLAGERARARDPRLAVKIAGLTLPNPLGMAAGFDKNAEAANALLGLGFGFVEIGTVTPLAQPGNPRPRIFRLADNRAIVNRLGFNNEGHEAVLARLKRRARRRGIVGVNIGANKDAEDRIADYAAGIRTFAGVADYFTINISSPNTPGLRDLQAGESLDQLLKTVTAARLSAGNVSGRAVPAFLKIAPDLDEAALDAIAAAALDHGVDGLIVSNTTVSREGVATAAGAEETGGLSGVPLFERSTTVLAKMRRRVGPALPIIGVGGIDTAQAALEKIAAGADCVQTYTGFVYGGPALVSTILDGLSAIVEADGVDTIAAYRDTRTDAWADRTLRT